MYMGLRVKYMLFLPDVSETWIFSADFQKASNMKFHWNPSSESRVVPCGQTDGQTNVMNLIVAFGNFANAPKTVPRIYFCLPIRTRNSERGRFTLKMQLSWVLRNTDWSKLVFHGLFTFVSHPLDVWYVQSFIIRHDRCWRGESRKRRLKWESFSRP